MRVGPALLVGGLLLCPNPQPPFPSPAAQWRTEERVLISDFSHVSALAASPFLLYAATPRGLLLYDRPARRWQLPVTALDGYPRVPVQVALADRADEAVWLGTTDGWARYDPRIRMWQHGPVPGGVGDLAQDADDPASGIYLLTARGWTFLARGALLALGNRALPPRVVRPLDAQSALAQAPQADALRALILTDPRLRTYQFTSAAGTPDQGELFFGTNGLGVIRIDGFGARWEAMPFGLPAASARALAPASDGVWVGLVPRVGEREGLAFLSSDLTAARWVTGLGTRGLGFRQVRRLLARAGQVWVATEQGVARVNPSSERADMIQIAEPLTLAPAPDGVWVGTTRGLALVSDDETVVSHDVGGAAVLSLLATGDSLWIGTAAGLLVFPPGARGPLVPADLANTPALNAPIVALARQRDTLVAATLDQLAWRDPKNGRWTLLRAGANLGRLTALAADRDGVWVGGDFGIALWRVGTGSFTSLRVPLDIPAGARDLLVMPPYLWVATDSGVVRVVREAVMQR